MVLKMNQTFKRKIIRLEGYDYSRHGAYFITICVKGRYEMLGEIGVGAGLTRPCIELTEYGKIVEKNIKALHDKYPYITINNYCIMPNHIHCIIQNDGYAGRVDPAPTLGQIVGYLKYQTTKEIGISGFWQRSYYDHIIRNENESRKINDYIDTNPMKWTEDRFYIHK